MYYSLSLLQLEQFMQLFDESSLKTVVFQILFYLVISLLLIPELNFRTRKRKKIFHEDLLLYTFLLVVSRYTSGTEYHHQRSQRIDSRSKVRNCLRISKGQRSQRYGPGCGHFQIKSAAELLHQNQAVSGIWSEGFGAQSGSAPAT